ncbi:hypothetical protein [Chitinophaga sp. HK235]|uniref:hypothetical protein n=1 Tax=Chitinophaga sp. HK235 TaxID=2952571 RepID=UPI001BA6C738|nr:hypothetical protein [Chitinophaga sp. HK235]
MKRILSVLLLQCSLVFIAHAQNDPVDQGMVQIYGNEEGAAWLNGGEPWQTITKGNYMAIEHLFGTPLKTGYVRQYYILIRRSDNMTCGDIQFRFWFSWANKPGHEFQISKWWGQLWEGGYTLVQIPPTMAQAVKAGLNPGNPPDWFWRIDGRIIGCGSDKFTSAKISAMYLRAIDYYQGNTPDVKLNEDGNVTVGTRYVLGGTYGDIAVRNGNVGIGSYNPQAKLAVDGTIMAKRVKVTQNAAEWPDFVFHPDYALPSLDSTAAFITENRHLPGIPSAQQIAQNGLDLGEMNKLLLQKVEELTLHLIQQKGENEALKARVEQLEQGQASPRKKKKTKR